MSRNVSLRLPDEVVDRLDRFARQLGNGMTRSKAGAILLDEQLREQEFSLIKFRNTAIGRLPFVDGSGMAVWEFIMMARRFGMDAVKTAEYLQYPVEMVNAAFAYYRAYPDAVDIVLEDNSSYSIERIKELYPQAKVNISAAELQAR